MRDFSMNGSILQYTLLKMKTQNNISNIMIQIKFVIFLGQYPMYYCIHLDY